jgi:CelD/BcsL family acetyltransferase involved in cellulose biosynthesis
MNLFQTQEYLDIFARHFCRPEDIVDKIWERYQDKLILLGMKPVLGQEEVTDYGPSDIVSLPSGYHQFMLDYIREDSPVFERFRRQAVNQEVSPYLDLPPSWDEYLSHLARKQRKELKRKFKRLEEVKHNFFSANQPEVFFRLHRLSDPNKHKFMSQAMEVFFRDVLRAKFPDWQAELDFLEIEGRPAAAIVSFVSQDEVWLYNSGYDPDFAYYSAGLLLKAWKIRQAIAAGKKKFDFLRGNERYKYDLGAKDLSLYKIVINL